MKRNWRFCITWLSVVAFVPLTVCAQSDSVVMKGSVSKTVILSLSPNAAEAKAELSALENGGVLRLDVSGSGPEVRNLQVPILIRSNISYNIIASAQSETAVLIRLSVLRIEPGGRLVAGNAVAGIVVDRRFGVGFSGDASAGEENWSAIDPSAPFIVFRGPRVSLGGGLTSADNALEVTLLISVKPKVEKGIWTMNLTLQGSGTETP